MNETLIVVIVTVISILVVGLLGRYFTDKIEADKKVDSDSED
jgi:hypothetical protein